MFSFNGSYLMFNSNMFSFNGSYLMFNSNMFSFNGNSMSFSGNLVFFNHIFGGCNAHFGVVYRVFVTQNAYVRLRNSF